MEYQTLGKTELTVSRMGFGCWAIGGHGYGAVKDEESITSLKKAIDLGINLFDTADVYGFGHSEKVLSQALGSRRHDVVIATKFGVAWDESGKTYKDISPKHVVQALEGSLRRLRIDSIPLYQIHWYDGKTPIADTLEALMRCREQGKIRYIGCSNFDLGLVGEANDIADLASVQSLFNVAERQNEKILRACFDRYGIGSLAYGVLARGLFSGKYDRNSRFSKGDTRSQDVGFSGEKMGNRLKIFDKLSEIGGHYGKSPIQVAIRWVLDAPFITSAIVGLKTAAQLDENAAALGWSLDNAHWLSLSDCGTQPDSVAQIMLL